MNMRYLIAALCLATLAPTARADKFHLGSDEQAEKMTEGEPDFVEGVLLEEKDDRYVIRVEGGQIELLKNQVREVEKTGLTVAQIEDREAEAKDRLAAENTRRVEMLGAAAEARMEELRDVRAAEAAAEVLREIPEPEAVVVPATIYDPVLDVVREVVPGAYQTDYYIRKELGGIIRRQLNEAANRAGVR